MQSCGSGVNDVKKYFKKGNLTHNEGYNGVQQTIEKGD
tara:strand:- start:989 stop:1102 length:114 start_codon:yes stop_codon:yes gene_type:complete